ncbi:MAG: efflux RND transporter periplasmic adaptor subunit [Thermohalobaculum sp.]|nr:efflux RND transporter periplasmic adaptor subunit [Thermohalobaculum sp.]
MLRRAVLLFLAALLPAWPAVAQAPGGPPTVTVVTLDEQDVTLTSLLPGRVVASAIAEVRPQVNGIITERLFEEGATVALGDPLYRIDPASYAAEAASARAEIAQARARLRAAERDFARVEALRGRGVVSEQAYDTALAERDTAEAALQVAEARYRTAEINVERTMIRAPLSGVVGRSLTTQGALVTSGQAAPLAVIRALDPVFVDVTQSAAEMLDWRRGVAFERLADAELTVTLTLADGAQYDHTGLLTAAEPHVDQATGVVTLRMEFPNPQALLLPGMYVQVELPQGVARGVVLAPQEGISRDRRGRPVALVVNREDTVEERPLSILRARGSNWVVDDGLAAGDRLIVEGLQKVRAGQQVRAEERAPTVEPQARADDAPAVR